MVLKRGRHGGKITQGTMHIISAPFSTRQSYGGEHVRMAQWDWAQVVLTSFPDNTERLLSLAHWESLG